MLLERNSPGVHDGQARSICGRLLHLHAVRGAVQGGLAETFHACAWVPDMGSNMIDILITVTDWHGTHCCPTMGGGLVCLKACWATPSRHAAMGASCGLLGTRLHPDRFLCGVCGSSAPHSSPWVRIAVGFGLNQALHSQELLFYLTLFAAQINFT